MIENIFHGLTMRKGTLKKKKIKDFENGVDNTKDENHAQLLGGFSRN